jgi:iron complex transport system ATP-binding protein
MIEIEHVSHRIGRNPILRDISLAIPRGGVTALIGPNGAGKSTLLSLMARFLPLQAGRIAFDGLDVARTPSPELARKLAILRQETVLGTRLTVRDLVGFGRYPHCRGRPGPDDLAAIDAALGQFALTPLAGRFLDELSGGQRQRALLAMVFAQATDYLLLDEPLNNLDMAFARALMRHLRALADEHGRTIVVVLHEINYAAAWADRLVALRDGAVIAAGPPERILDPAILARVFDMEIEVARLNGRLVALHHV